MTDVNPEVQPTYLETLVGEGKKYQSVEDLAKAYTHASAHITELRQKESTLMSDNETLRSLTDLLTQAKNEPTPPPAQEPEKPAVPVADPPKEPANGGEPVDVETVVANFLAKKEAAQRQQDVYDKLVAQFNGDTTKAQAFLTERAKSLGVSPEFFVDAAAKSPAAAFELLGIKPAAAATPVGKSEVNSAAMQPASEERTMAYYSKLRRENPRLYAAQSTQKQLESDLMRMGSSKFFGKE